jgi:hypothetical protein
MFYSIDRFEGDFAVLIADDGENRPIPVPRNQLPPEVREGSILTQEAGGMYRFHPEETQRRRQALFLRTHPKKK